MSARALLVVAMAAAVGLIVGFALFGSVTYFPLYLQAVKGVSPTASGMQMLPMMGGMLVTSIASGESRAESPNTQPPPNRAATAGTDRDVSPHFPRTHPGSTARISTAKASVGSSGHQSHHGPPFLAPPRRVVLRIAPITPTYVCIDRGAGTPIVFEGILDAPQSFRGRLLRVNLGKTDVELRVNRRPVPIEPGPEPIGFEFRPRSRTPLPSGERPCA